eukprot:scaffold43278_cov66-Phaeocystis_antarctica.AAC.1
MPLGAAYRHAYCRACLRQPFAWQWQQASDEIRLRASDEVRVRARDEAEQQACAAHAAATERAAPGRTAGDGHVTGPCDGARCDI